MQAARYMRDACTAAKIEPPATFHDLRRSYASLLINRGTDAEIIKELLGHADLWMTLRTYAHLLNRTVAKAVKKKLPSFGLEPSNVAKFSKRER
jgi:integrase